ncbi:aldehyde dehydrogenase family protein, partial [Dickeya dianthicola]
MQLKNKTLFRQQSLIGGEWQDSFNGARLSVTNPATGTELGSIPLVTAEQTQQAITAAEQALSAWRQRTGKERAALMQAWAHLIRANQDDLAAILTAEQGKSLAEASGEIAYATSFIDWFAEEAKRVEGSVLQSPQANQRLLVIKQGIGVCAAITPWNFPAAMITRKAAPALAAGCTMIIKPAEQTPFTALALAELAQQAGIPAGVLQV